MPATKTTHKPGGLDNRLAAYILVIAGFLLAVYVEYAVVLAMTGGTFVYSLDDPYIHLALAQNIARGHYGLNPGEFCAPSSSVLWPLLLVPFANASFGAIVPLLLSVVFGGGTILVAMHLVDESVVESRFKPGLLILSGIVFALATNQIGLVFTGMEHGLQGFLSVLALMGLVRFARTGRVDAWLPAVLALGPLVRYENLALSSLAILWLLIRKQWRPALLATVPIVVALGGFSLFLHSLGLPPLPASILRKSQDAGGSQRLSENFAALSASVLLVTQTVVLVLSDRTHRPIAIGLVAATAFHFLAGRFGHVMRYEIYLCAVLLCASVAVSVRVPVWLRAVPCLVCCVVGLDVLSPMVVKTPAACVNIYEQQYQMRRFVDGWWKQPVALNDIGLGVYNSRHYVLDLWGLASPEALEAHRTGRDFRWMDDAARRKNVRLILIYYNWFPRRPANWTEVGSLWLSPDRPVISTAMNCVHVYAREPGDVPKIQALWRDFARTLPPGTYFRLPDGTLFSRDGETAPKPEIRAASTTTTRQGTQ